MVNVVILILMKQLFQNYLKILELKQICSGVKNKKYQNIKKCLELH